MNLCTGNFQCLVGYAGMTQFDALLVEYEKPCLEGFNGDQLDPTQLPADGVTLIAPPGNLSPRDYLYFYLDENLLDWTRVPASGAGEGVGVPVAKDVFTAQQGKVVELYFQVATTPEGERTDSVRWQLTLGSQFEGEVLLDLNAHDYLVFADKPPSQLPDFVRFKREASGGAAPYRYASNEPKVATVDDDGQVTALANGICEITATDSQEKVQRYSLRVSGIRQVHFLTPSADWEGMGRVCEEANLSPLSRNRFKRLWSIYYPISGPVASYLGYLDYPFWTSERLGAGTAYAYDLNGHFVDGNVGSLSEREYRQVLGMDPD